MMDKVNLLIRVEYLGSSAEKGPKNILGWFILGDKASSL